MKESTQRKEQSDELEQILSTLAPKYSECMSICIDCRNATGRCSWSKKFKPVKGWTAIPSSYTDNGHTVKTYKITQCPLFKIDNPNKYGYQVSIDIVSKLCGKDARAAARWTVETVNKKLQSRYPNLEAIWWRDPIDEVGSYYLRQKS